MMDKPEKLHLLGSIGRVGLLVAFIFGAVLAVWSIDQSTMADLIEAWKHPSSSTTAGDFDTIQKQQNTSSSSSNSNAPMITPEIQPCASPSSSPAPREGIMMEEEAEKNSKIAAAKWVTVELEQNYTANLLARWKEETGSEPCKEAKTVDIRIPRLDSGSEGIHHHHLPTGESHEIVFHAVDEDGNPRCLGGDYFELDLSGEWWKSRPPLHDFGNGTYSFTLQVHRDFHGQYNLTIIFLFRHFEGLKFSPNRFGFDKRLRTIPLTFSSSSSSSGLPELEMCSSDSSKGKGSSFFNRTAWSGRWTRHARNDKCEISNDGRYFCQPADYPCPEQWCDGRLGSLESNGWVYSAHCRFKLFSPDEAWECLNRKWLFWWGDSNHVDTIRNLLYFILGVPFRDLEVVTRRFDEKIRNPRNQSQWVRITNVFNGHWDVKANYEGLNSLSSEEHRELIRGYFNGSAAAATTTAAPPPDVVVFNSGLHDGVKWRSMRRFVGAAEYAASFWEEVIMSSSSATTATRGSKKKKPRMVFRSTVATGGYARTLAFNPSKMEVYNGVLLDKMREKGLIDAVVDDFDMTWPWHFDNRCNDGVHYGRFPAKHKWRDGGIGHQYFVDLMLGHVLLNAICSG